MRVFGFPRAARLALAASSGKDAPGAAAKDSALLYGRAP
jgi:hypothetical protein